jgi:tetraacyldisaccharide 4'-kinase
MAPLTIPASMAYGAVVAWRNRRFDRGRGVRRLAVPVISVGNITTGGTGKTPMVAWIAETLRARGVKPMIAMRGYAAPRGGAGDEEREYAQRLPGVAVVAHPDRHRALTAALGSTHAGCVLLDDGFQHRQLARDLDLVLIDAGAGALEDRLLPAGHLREPAAALQRAHGVIVTGAADVDPDLARRIAAVARRPPLAWCRHAWAGLALHGPEPGAARAAPAAWLEGKRVLVMLGVGRPERVRRQVEQARATIAAELAARDHQRYGAAALERARRMCRGLDAMVVTLKDWVKIAPLRDERPWPCPIVVPDLRIEFLAGQRELESLLPPAGAR